MYNIKKNAFTLIEMIVVITMIGILMTATTIYLGGSDEKRKTIEALGCANTIGGEINNFLFFTLTSKNLKLSNSETISPNYYIVEFTGLTNTTTTYCNSGNLCDKINLSYSTGEKSPTNITPYKTLSISNCTQNNPIKFYRSGTETNYIIMNKGFSPKSIQDKNVFYLSGSDGTNLYGDVIIGLCLNSDCTDPKDIGKFVADARSQTISIRNCKYYDDTDPTKCKTREGCQIYDPSDSSKCQKY